MVNFLLMEARKKQSIDCVPSDTSQLDQEIEV